MKSIVIIGGGFGGLGAALGLAKKIENQSEFSVTLIDKREYHLFTPNLYEAATGEEELVSMRQMKKTIALPFTKILQGKKVKFIKGEIKSIEDGQRKIILENKSVEYDYLILALGSQSDFFNIPGAEQHSLSLKNFPDALRIRNKIEFAIQAHKFDTTKNTLRIIIAGGGYTGLEFAGELKGLVDYLAWKNQYPREKIEIEVIEAAGKLVPGFDNRLSNDAYERLQELGIRVRLSARIAAVADTMVELADGQKVGYDVLVWTTGVKACQFPMSNLSTLDRKGRFMVNEFFQIEKHHNIFAIGDIACVLNEKGQPVPSSAQDAEDQAKFLVNALPFIIKNQKPPKAYIPDSHGFIVNLGGKWAIMSYKGFYITGFLAWFVNELGHLRYYWSVVGLWKAIKWSWFQMDIYSRND